MAMELQEAVIDAFTSNKGLLTTRELFAIGISRSLVSKYAHGGLIVRVAHGLYRLPESFCDTLFSIMLRNPRLVASHGTALYLNGLAESAPERWTVTASHDHEPPPSVRAECQCFYVSPTILDVGLVRLETPFGHEVRCYDAERTICDLVRSRNRLDDELVVSGLRNWGASSCRDPARLARHARALGVFDRVKACVEVLL